MDKNYIPFVAREVLILASGDVAKLSVVQAVVANRAPGAKIEYQDLSFIFDSATLAYPDSVYVRYGFEERGYLLEEPIAVFDTINAPNFVGVGGGWRFPKPYKLRPGQQMRADYNVTEGGGAAGYAGIILPSKRADNGEPYILHGTNLDATKFIGAFTGDTMAAPADTELYVEGIQAATSTYATMGLQVYDGDGNEIVKVKPNGSARFTQQEIYSTSWLRVQRGIELGAFNGWELPSEHPLIVEMINESAAAFEVLVTVRGCAEVTP